MTHFESLRLQFEEAKNSNEYAAEFFETFATISRTLLKDQRDCLIEDVYSWALSRKDWQLKNLSFTIFLRGIIAFHDEQYDDALQFVTNAHSIFTEEGNKNGVGVSCILLGALYRTLGEVELALKYLLDGYEQMRKSDFWQYMFGICCYNLAELYTDTGYYEEALKFHKINVENEDRSANNLVMALTYTGMASIYKHQKKYDLAIEYLNKALANAKSTDSLPNTARVLTDIGNYYIETEDYDKALQYHNDALDIRLSVNHSGGIVTNLIQIGEIYCHEHKEEKAIEIFEKALATAEEIKVKPKIFQIHLLLSKLYETYGEFSKSLAHYKAFHQVREEVMHEDAEKKIKNMQLIFEAEQTRKENVIIKAQKTEIENKNTELQKTIDELTRTKISKRAKAITLFVAMALIVMEDTIMHFAINPYAHDNFLITLLANGAIVLMLKPIENAIEHFLLSRLVK